VHLLVHLLCDGASKFQHPCSLQPSFNCV
jgi:hypothetical protein